MDHSILAAPAHSAMPLPGRALDPQGGLFLWVAFPKRFDTSELLQVALK